MAIWTGLRVLWEKCSRRPPCGGSSPKPSGSWGRDKIGGHSEPGPVQLGYRTHPLPGIEQTASLPKQPKTVVMNRIIIHLDLDYFYAQLEELRKPGLKGKPVVVCMFSGRTETSGAVATSNYRARELGVKAGMQIAFAKKN